MTDPGGLLDDPGTGRVNAGVSIPYSAVPRDDVAAFIATSLFCPDLNRTDVELTHGDTPIDKAVAALAPAVAVVSLRAGDRLARNNLLGRERQHRGPHYT